MWIECEDDKMCFHKYSRISVKDVFLCGVDDPDRYAKKILKKKKMQMQ